MATVPFEFLQAKTPCRDFPAGRFELNEIFFEAYVP
jgi:hypothetical protein